MLNTKAGPFHPEVATPIRCVIADDHEMLRYGVRRLLEDTPDFAVVGEAGDASEALKLVLEHRPDLLLLDISMPGMSSFEAGHPHRRTLRRHAHRVPDHARGSGIRAASVAFRSQRLPAERHRRPPFVTRSSRSASRRKVVESADPDAIERRCHPAEPSDASAVAEKHPDRTRARSNEVVSRGTHRKENRRRPRSKRQDRGSPQIQPDAQTRHSQQSPVGDGRNSEKNSALADTDVSTGGPAPASSHAGFKTVAARLARSGTSRSGFPAEARTAPIPGRADFRFTHTVEIPSDRAGTTS